MVSAMRSVTGLNASKGTVAVFMADLTTQRIREYYNKMVEGDYDCVFGLRWEKARKCNRIYPR